MAPKEGTTLLMPVVEARLAKPAQRQEDSSWLGDLNIGGMRGPALFHARLTTKEKEISVLNLQNLELNDQGGLNDPPGGCGKLG